jgi:hypothetical protein
VYSAVANSNKFLRADGTWQEVSTTETDPVFVAYRPVIPTNFTGGGTWVYDQSSRLFTFTPDPTTGGVTNSLLAGTTSLTNDHFEAASGNTNLLTLALDTNGGRARLTITVTSGVLTNSDARLGSAAWASSNNFAVAAHSHTLAGDVTGDVGSTTVEKLRGRTISTNAPAANDIIQWDGADWVPVPPTNLTSSATVSNAQMLAGLPGSAYVTNALRWLPIVSLGAALPTYSGPTAVSNAVALTTAYTPAVSNSVTELVGITTMPYADRYVIWDSVAPPSSWTQWGDPALMLSFGGGTNEFRLEYPDGNSWSTTIVNNAGAAWYPISSNLIPAMVSVVSNRSWQVRWTLYSTSSNTNCTRGFLWQGQ